MMSDLHFYYMDASAPSRGAWTVIELLGMKYTEHFINLIKKEHKTESYAKINPRQKVPALVDGDLHLSESRTLATYLVSKYGTQCGQQQLYPIDVKQRALVDKHLYISVDVMDIVQSYVNVAGVVLFGGQMHPENLGEVEKVFAMVESFLAGVTFVAADHLTLADIFYYVPIQLLTLTEFDGWQNYPNIMEWRKKVEAIPCYDKTLGSPVANLRVVYQKALEENPKKKQ